MQHFLCGIARHQSGGDVRYAFPVSATHNDDIVCHGWIFEERGIPQPDIQHFTPVRGEAGDMVDANSCVTKRLGEHRLVAIESRDLVAQMKCEPLDRRWLHHAAIGEARTRLGQQLKRLVGRKRIRDVVGQRNQIEADLARANETWFRLHVLVGCWNGRRIQ